MNPIALTHVIAAAIIICGAIPLVRRRIPMNEIYGIKIKAAYLSPERWFEINEYGGRLLLRFGVALAVFGVAGLWLDKPLWLEHALATLVLIVAGLALIVRKVLRHG